MVLRSLPVPSLLGGVTQQPSNIARPDRVTRADNFIPYPDRGMAKRPGTDWLAQLEDNALSSVRLSPLDLGRNDRYIASFAHESVRVFRPSGEEVPVFTNGSTADFSYLSLKFPNQIADPETFATWDRNVVPFEGNLAQPVSSNTGPQTPFGWREAPSGSAAASQYTLLSLSPTPVLNGGSYSETIPGGLFGSVVKFSVYVNTNVPNTLARFVRLVLVDNWQSGPMTYDNGWAATFDFSAGATTTPTVSFEGDISTATDSQAVRGVVERIDDNNYRLTCILDTGRAGATIGANEALAAVTLVGVDAADPVEMYGWGAQLVFGEDFDASPPGYSDDAHVLRVLPVVDTTFVANPLIPTAKGAGQSDTITEAIGQWSGRPNGTPGSAWDVTGIGYIWVRQVQVASPGAEYRARIQFRDVAGGTDESLEATTTPLATTDTKIAAQALASAINTAITSTYGGTAPIHASVLGEIHSTALTQDTSSVIVIRTMDDGGANHYELRNITPQGGPSEGSVLAFTDEIEDISELPTSAVDGTTVKLVGEDPFGDSSDAGAYTRAVLRFREAEVLLSGAERLGSRGFWEEGPEYGVDTEIDADTMPHVLVREFDDASGTVTGEPFATYFDFRPYEWMDRVVGSDERNPFPSFVSPSATDPRFIRGLGFYQSRLVLTSDNNVAMSESSFFGNFFRTTLRTLPDSERVDVTASFAQDAIIQHVLPAHGTLFVFTNSSTLELVGGEFVSPATVGFDEVAGFGTGRYARPATLADAVMIPDQDECDWAQLHGLFRSEGIPASAPLSAEVPRFLPRDVLQLQAHPRSGLVLMLPSRDRRYVIGLRHVSSGVDQLQNAWFRLHAEPDSSTGEIAGLAVVADRVFMAVRRNGETRLESFPLQSFPIDEGVGYHVELDGRVDEHDLLDRTYSAGPDTTDLQLPYEPEDPDLVRAFNVDTGTLLTPTSVSGDTATFSGDLSDTPLIVGTLFDAGLEPLPPRVLESGRTTDGRTPRSSAVESVVRLTIESDRSGSFDVEVAYGGLSTTETYSQSDPLDPLRGEHQTFIGSEPDDLQLVITDRSATPLGITALEWEADVETDS